MDLLRRLLDAFRFRFTIEHARSTARGTTRPRATKRRADPRSLAGDGAVVVLDAWRPRRGRTNAAPKEVRGVILPFRPRPRPRVVAGEDISASTGVC